MSIRMRYVPIIFLLLTLSVGVLFWLYLNIQASMSVSAQNAAIRLSDELPTQISVGNYLQAHAKGRLNSRIDIDRKIDIPLQGKYSGHLKFMVEVPVIVDVDYKTNIMVDQMMPLEADTSLIYQSKWLPKFPLKLDVPVKLAIPFHLKRQYELPIQIMFDGPVDMLFNEQIQLDVKHQFTPSIVMNDEITMEKIADFNATLRNIERNTQANLNMQMDLSLDQIHQ